MVAALLRMRLWSSYHICSYVCMVLPECTCAVGRLGTDWTESAACHLQVASWCLYGPSWSSNLLWLTRMLWYWMISQRFIHPASADWHDWSGFAYGTIILDYVNTLYILFYWSNASSQVSTVRRLIAWPLPKPGDEQLNTVRGNGAQLCLFRWGEIMNLQLLSNLNYTPVSKFCDSSWTNFSRVLQFPVL